MLPNPVSSLNFLPCFLKSGEDYLFVEAMKDKFRGGKVMVIYGTRQVGKTSLIIFMLKGIKTPAS